MSAKALINASTSLKKLFVFLTTFLLVLTSVTYLYYDHWRRERETEKAVPFIPQNAALVYQVENLGKQWEHFQRTPIAETLNQVPTLAAIQHNLSFLKTLSTNPYSLDKVPLTVSIHSLGEEQLGYIFYFDTRNTATKECLKSIKLAIQEDKTYTKTVRKYAGHKIKELGKHGTMPTLSYIKQNQYIVASYSSLLIEDVVRVLTSKQQTGLKGLKKPSNTQGSLYINKDQWSQLLNTFVKSNEENTFSEALATLTPINYLNLKLTPHHILLSGSAKDEATPSWYLAKALRNQTAGDMLLAPYLTQGTAVLQHFSFGDIELFWEAFQQKKSSPQVDKIPEPIGDNLFENTLYPFLQGEIGYCTLATKYNQRKNQLVFIRVKNPQTLIETLSKLDLLALLSAQGLGQPPNTYKVTNNYLQNWLPQQFFPTFKAHYITQIDDYIILANNALGLQTWYTQYQQGKTWTNDPQQNVRLASMLDQAQFSLLVDLKNTWPQIIQSLRPSWKELLEKYTDVFHKFSYVSLQLLHEQNVGYYISILLNHTESCLAQNSQIQQTTINDQKPPPKTLTTSTLFQPEASIINRPWLVKSHRGKGYYVLLQDTLYQLYFLTPTGKLLWKKTLEGPIADGLFEVDYYKNNKTQYLFATDRQIHLLDYYGHEITKYPHPLHQPGSLRVVDYDYNKHYRFLIATVQGNIYLKDKYCQPLSPWNPKALGQSFSDAPYHLRMQGKDYFLALQTNGTLQALNRKGQNYPGFPVKLKALVHSPLLIQKGETADSTSLVVLTDTGQLTSLNLAGHIQKVVPLDQANTTAHFMLCPNNAAGHEYVIMRKGANEVTVLDKEGSLLFELQCKAQSLLLQYYNFGDNHQFYVMTDTDKKLTFLYDYKGRSLHDTPWRNSHAVRLLFSEVTRQLEIYTSFENRLSKHTLLY